MTQTLDEYMFRRRRNRQPKRPTRSLQASYDIADTNRGNAEHWKHADLLAPDASLRPTVRKRIRSRARYELENNSYAVGILKTLAEDTVGTGPRLQLGLRNEKFNAGIQKQWKPYANAIDLTSKLQTMRISKARDGEAMARFVQNPAIGHEIKLDLQLFECDMLSAPVFEDDLRRDYIDGIHLDRFGNPAFYDILDDHPGATYYDANPTAFTQYSRDQIVHLFRRDRAGQHRGVSEIAPALPLFAQLRRFTLATLDAAERAANVSLALKTDSPVPDDDEYVSEGESELEAEKSRYGITSEDYFESIGLGDSRDSAAILPHMWELEQIRAEHPTTTYAMFKSELINEIARCVNMPYNVAAATSANSNYASGRLDHEKYHQSIVIERKMLETKVLDRLFGEWILEAAYSGMLPGRVGDMVRALDEFYWDQGYDLHARIEAIAAAIPHTWNWDAFPYANPHQEAQAQMSRLGSGVSHRSLEMSRAGLDSDVEDPIAAEKAGLTLQQYRLITFLSAIGNGNAVSNVIDQVMQIQRDGEPSKEPIKTAAQSGKNNHSNEQENEGKSSDTSEREIKTPSQQHEASYVS